MKLKKRGRPIGYKLSDATKKAISIAKIGQKHSQETKDKISTSLLRYFRIKNPLSKELINSYSNYDVDGDIVYWVDSMREYIDSSEDVLTYRSIYNMRKHEYNNIVNIEEISHNLTPEILIMFKQHCESIGVSCDSLYDKL